ncbi:MAG: hypothetical protein AAF368_12820, partial [Planctomycetota bacterium]
APGCTPCPCANDDVGGIGGCRNDSGTGSRLIATGAASVAEDTLRFELQGMPATTSGTLFSGANQLPANAINPCFAFASGVDNLGDGLRCMGGSALRHGTRFSDTNGDIGETNNGWGPPNGPPGGLIAFSGFAAGQTRHFQVIHRDAASSGCGSGLNSSQGVTVTFDL